MRTDGWIPFQSRVALVFAGAGQNVIAAPRKELHKIFAEIRRERKDLFPELQFVTLSSYPYSTDLDDALALLQNDGFLSADNPYWERLRLNEQEKQPLVAEALRRNSEQAKALMAFGERYAQRLTRAGDGQQAPAR